MPSYADTYAACMHEAGEGYHLWNPAPHDLGDVGHIRYGSFNKLYNAIDGPDVPLYAANTSREERLRRPEPLRVDYGTSCERSIGPRTSQRYRSLGVEGGVGVPNVPLSGSFEFESAGGDGAVLIAQNPVRYTELGHHGDLKDYMAASYLWVYEEYGKREAFAMDDLVFIYGQHCTSDWAVAVSQQAARGVRIKFEMFNIASAGIWGRWTQSHSASQQGPHRRQDKATSSSFENGRSHADQNQTIIIRRIRVRRARGCPLPFYAIRAEAEPRDPDVDRDLERRPDAVARQDGSWNERGQATRSEDWDDDPLDALLDWIHDRGDAEVKVSIASDDDCLHLLELLEPEQATLLGFRNAVRMAADRFARVSVNDAGAATVSISAGVQSELAAATAAEAHLQPSMQRERVASLAIQGYFNSRADEVHIGQAASALARRAVGELARGHGPVMSFAGLLSSRFGSMLPCRSMLGADAARSSLVLP